MASRAVGSSQRGGDNGPGSARVALDGLLEEALLVAEGGVQTR